VRKRILLLLFTLLVGRVLVAQEPSPPSPLVDRVGQTGFLQLEAESFKGLPLRQKVLAHWLSMAAIAVN
jgi:hypothetical protein